MLGAAAANRTIYDCSGWCHWHAWWEGVGRAPAGTGLATRPNVTGCLLIYSPFSVLRVGGVLLGVGINIQKKRNATKIGSNLGDCSG